MAFRSIQVAEFLSVNTDQIRKWVARGKLKGTRHANGWNLLFDISDLAEFIVSDPRYYQAFINHTPKKLYRDSYDILKSEVIKQYERKRIDDSDCVITDVARPHDG